MIEQLICTFVFFNSQKAGFLKAWLKLSTFITLTLEVPNITTAKFLNTDDPDKTAHIMNIQCLP